MYSFSRHTLFLALLALSVGFLSSCGDDDADDLMACPVPADPVVLSSCLMDIPDMLRENDDPNETFSVDLYNDNGTYYYAFKPAAFNNTKIEVYDACCNYICRIGFPITEECDWRDTAERTADIFEE